MAELTTYEDGSLKLSGEATIHDVEPLREALLAAVATQVPGRMLDLSGLVALDSAGIQLLVSLKRSVPDLKVHSCPQPLRDALDKLGLANHLL